MEEIDWSDLNNQVILKELLGKSPQGVIVDFIKADGSDRKMICSLNPELLPLPKTEDGTVKSFRTKSDEVCPVYDLENHGWRSFRWDSILEVKVISC